MCAVTGLLILIIIILLIKIYLLRKAAQEIEEGFADRLTAGTNTLIDISSQENLSENALRYTEIIRNRTEILKQLTEELFRYSILIAAHENTDREPVVLGEVLEESIAAYYAALKERGITPKIKLTDKRIIRYLNRPALSRVFSNLINNALKYSDCDFSVTLSDNGEITFANTASGLDDVQVGRLFDRFYTVEAARTSTGLGLAIARTFVEQMNGNIIAKYDNDVLSICIQFPDTEDLPPH